MTTFKKMAAVLCGATTLLALGATLTTSAAGTLTISGNDQTVELGATDIAVTMSIENNPGYAGLGVGIYYGELVPVCTDADNKTPKNKLEEAYLSADGEIVVLDTVPGLSVIENSDAKDLIGFSAADTKNCVDDGKMITLYFNLPADAAAGDVYEIQFVIDQIALEDKTLMDLSNVTVNSAFVRVAGETTTETTTTETTTTETTTTETTTTETTTTETTTTETTTTETTTTETTTETTTTETTTTETTTTTEAPPSSTGDAGVGLAVAGLLTAAGTALVVRKKRG